MRCSEVVWAMYCYIIKCDQCQNHILFLLCIGNWCQESWHTKGVIVEDDSFLLSNASVFIKLWDVDVT